MNKPFFFHFMFLNTDFRMKTKIEMNMYEYANKLISIPLCQIQGIFISSKMVPVLFIFVEHSDIAIAFDDVIY